MGEKMNRTSTTLLTLGTLGALFALGTACSSGGDPAAGGTAGKSTGSGGQGTAGTTVIPVGGNTTAGNTGMAGSVTSAGTVGIAGSGSGGTTGAPSVCDGKTFALPVGEAYIDNFEMDTRFLGWYAFSDTTPPNMPAPERLMGMGALSTNYSGHVHATGIKSSKMMGYGAGFGFGLVDPVKGNCVDISAFKGMSFWLKGTAGADNTLKFQIVAPATQPADSMPVGDCPTSASPCAFKHPAKTITLMPTWTQVIINFADLAPAAAYTGKVMGFNMITDGPDYDVQIDEATFFTDMAPTGPVMPDLGTGGTGGAGSGGKGGTGGT